MSCAEFTQVLGGASRSKTPGVEKKQEEPARKTPLSDEEAVAIFEHGPKKEKRTETEDPMISESMAFIWPVEGRVSSGFGSRHGKTHDGIDIVAPKGTKVVAAQKGRVIYEGEMSSYGNLIIVKHSDDYYSAYGHLSQRKVTKGAHVKQGDEIGSVGRTGRATTFLLHFEIRQKTQAINPLDFLPERETP